VLAVARHSELPSAPHIDALARRAAA
jgi:hypothetical protein